MTLLSTDPARARAQGEGLARLAIIAGMREAALPGELVRRLMTELEPRIAACNPVVVDHEVDDDEEDDLLGRIESKPGLVVIGLPSYGTGPTRKPPTALRLHAAPVMALLLTTAGAFMAGMPLAAGVFVAAGAGFALTEIDNKVVKLTGLHGHVLYEMFISTERGKKAHAMTRDALFNNLNATFSLASEPEVTRSEFDQAIDYLVGLKLLVPAPVPGTLRWGEVAVAF